MKGHSLLKPGTRFEEGDLLSSYGDIHPIHASLIGEVMRDPTNSNFKYYRPIKQPKASEVCDPDAPKFAAARATYTELLEQFHRLYKDATLGHGGLCPHCPEDGEVGTGKCTCLKDELDALSERIGAMQDD